MTKPVGLIDANNQFAKCFHAAESPMRAFLAQCQRWQAQFAQTILCWDNPGGTWRHELYATYKAGRNQSRAEGYAEALQFAQDTFGGLTAQGHEADDLIAARARTEATAGQQVCIVSSDKDLWQLLEPGLVTCRVRDTAQGCEYMTAEGLLQKYGVQASQWRDYLALTGDATDNLPGCRGIGAKRASALLQSHHSIEGIYRAIDESRAKATQAVAAALRDYKASGMLDLQRQLVTLKPPAQAEIVDVRLSQAANQPT